jgi:hypothetical protein
MMRIRFGMIRLQCALSQEKAETKQMLRIYQQYVTGQVSKAELQQANSQLADVLRATGLGVFAILPFLISPDPQPRVAGFAPPAAQHGAT